MHRTDQRKHRRETDSDADAFEHARGVKFSTI